MLPLLTGVVIMLGLGILAQRSETVMEWLGETPEAPRGSLVLREDSAGAVRGQPVLIDVLANDVGLTTRDITNLAIASPPQCGVANVTSGGIEYVATASCSANQALSYRIDGRDGTAFGIVRIAVLEQPSTGRDRMRPVQPNRVAEAPQQTLPPPSPLRQSEQTAGQSGAEHPVVRQPQLALNQPDLATGRPAQAPNVARSQPQPSQAPSLNAPSAPDSASASSAPETAGAAPRQPGQLALQQPAPERTTVLPAEPQAPPLGDEQPDRAPQPGRIAAPTLAENAPGYENSGGFASFNASEADGQTLGLVDTTIADAESVPAVRQPELTVAMAIPDAPVPSDDDSNVLPSVRGVSAPSTESAPVQTQIAALNPEPKIEATDPLPRDPLNTERLAPAGLGTTATRDTGFASPGGLRPSGGASEVASLGTAPEAGPAATDPVGEVDFNARVTLTAPQTNAPEAPRVEESSDTDAAVAALGSADQPIAGAAIGGLNPQDQAGATPAAPPQPEAAAEEEVAVLSPQTEPEPEVTAPETDPEERRGGGFLGGLSALFSGSSDEPDAEAESPAAPAEPAETTPEPAAPETAQEEDNIEVAALPQANTACVAQPALGISMQPAARTVISIEAPCSAGGTAELSYSGLSLAVPLDQAGVGEITALGLEPSAKAKMRFPDGEAVEFDLQFSGMNRVMRAALTWDMPVTLALHAIEFGGRPNTADDANPGNPRSYGDVRRSGGGFVTTFEPVGGVGEHVQFYTHFIRSNGRAGVVDLMIDFISRDREQVAETCGAGSLARPSFKLFKSDRGVVDRPLAASLGSVACENVDTSGAALAKNLVGTIVIAP
ncbi:MAG: hypothetical protein AAGE80_15240 [Pseudomonadota bacterium]